MFTIYRVGDYRWSHGKIQKRIPWTPFWCECKPGRFKYMKGVRIVNRLAGVHERS